MRPVTRRVVHLEEVAQFMYHHVLDDCRRGHHQAAIEIEVVFAAGAAPARPLVLDADGTDGQVHLLRPMLDNRWDVLTGLLAVPLADPACCLLTDGDMLYYAMLCYDMI